MARNNQRGSNNNNPEGRNQHSGGVMDMARERPVTAAAAAAAAVGAGVFLWSRRSQISEQLTGLSEQIGQWSEQMRTSRQGSESEFETTGSSTSSGMSETGGGNSSLGASTGGNGSMGSGRL